MIESFTNTWPFPKDSASVANTFAASCGAAPNPETEAIAPVCLSCGARPNQDGTLPCDH